MHCGCCVSAYKICLFVEKADNSADWKVNGAGFHHSHQHGFGLLSAWRLVNAAKVCVFVCVSSAATHWLTFVFLIHTSGSLRFGSLFRSSCPIRVQ